VFDPDSDLDGVVVDVPVALLDQVARSGLEWQVPGHRAALVTALLRTLPKALRRHHTPAPEVAAEVIRSVGPDDGPLLDVLARALSQRSGTAVSPHDLDLAAVPAHLRVTYRVVDDDGRALAWSRDLPALRRHLDARLRAALAAAAPIDEVHGATSWVFDDIPRTVPLVHAGLAVVGHPALVDEGTSVGLRVLPTEAEQRTAMWGGTRRLLLLQLGAPLRTLDRALSSSTKLALAGSSRVSASEAYRGCAAAAVDQLLVEAGGPAWDAAGHARLLDRVRAGFAAAAVALAEHTAEVLRTASQVEATVASMVTPAHDETVLDVQQHLDRLLARDWITVAGFDGLPDVARYVRALAHRVERARTAPDRDRRHIAGLRRLEQAYREVAGRDREGQVRTMLEELRVSTFAQAVGARGGVSEAKVRAAIAALG